MAKNTEKELKNKNVNEINIKIEGEEWNNAIDKAFNKEQKNVKVDGFRKGKVPRNVYEKKFGKQALFVAAADMLLQEAYLKALEESKLVPVVQPAFDVKSLDENGVEYVFKIITKPEVNVKKYKGLNIQPEKVEVSGEEVNHELGHLLERYTELVTKDGKVENGDIAIKIGRASCRERV